MKTADIYNTLKNDEAFKFSIDNLDVINMAIVLRANGFDYSESTICNLFEYCQVLPETVKTLDTVEQCVWLVTRKAESINTVSA